jgi:tRNA(Ile)-lysidine synthase
MITLFERLLIDKVSSLKSRKILVAFSGGKDSSALLDCLWKYKNKLGFEINAAHINHGIRKDEALRDELFCRQFCYDREIMFFSRRVESVKFAKESKISLEDAARKLRYDALFEIADKIDSDYIFTAHHFNDKMETFFIKLFQGTSLLNLSGFDFEPTKIYRPMLDIKREIIEEYIMKYKLDYVDDSTNFNKDYLRNWIRHDLLKNINFKSHDLFKNIDSLQKESEELKQYLNDKVSGIKIINEFENVIAFDKYEFKKLHIIEQKFLLSELFKTLFRLEKKHINMVLEIANSNVSKRIFLPKGYIFEISYNKIRIFLKTVLNNFCYSDDSENIEINLKNLKKCLKIYNNTGKLKIRFRKKGDVYKGKKLKDIFIDKKIDLFIRDISLVVENEDEIIWVENISESNENIKVLYGDI